MAHSNKTQGDLMRPFLIKFLQFLLSNLRYKCPNWTDLERLTESVYLLFFHYEQIVWENSDIKWMKVPLFSLPVTKYLTF